MKAVFKKLSLLVVTLVLVLSVSVGLTMAYFSDYTPAKGGELLVLGGQTEIEEHVTDNSKDVTIHNTGETTVLIRVGIFGPDKMDVQYDESAWEKDGTFYYYKKALKPGEATSEQLKALAREYGDKVIITGYVDSVEDYYKLCDFTIVPLFFG